MTRLPTLFISHGSPMLALDNSPARRFLQDLGRRLPRPQAILVASAHWETMGGPAVSLAPQPETIHDFGGFPPALYQLQYPAPGGTTRRHQRAPCSGCLVQVIEDCGRLGQHFAIVEHEGRHAPEGAVLANAREVAADRPVEVFEGHPVAHQGDGHAPHERRVVHADEFHEMGYDEPR